MAKEDIKMEKGDSMPKYLTKFIQCRDELGSVGVTVDDEDFVSLALASEELAFLSGLCQWSGEISRMGATLVGSCARGDKAKYQRRIFIKEL